MEQFFEWLKKEIKVEVKRILKKYYNQRNEIPNFKSLMALTL